MKVLAKRGKKYPPEVLSTQEIEILLKAPSKRAPTGIRNRALIYVGYRSGLRISEALRLMMKDIDLEQGSIRIQNGKGGKSRVVGIPDDARLALEKWLTVRKNLGVNGKSPVFCTLQGDYIDDSYIRHMMARMKERTGLDKRLHFHGLRHTCAYELATEGVPMPVIQKALGHESLATTSIYLSHVAPIDVIKAMSSRLTGRG